MQYANRFAVAAAFAGAWAGAALAGDAKGLEIVKANDAMRNSASERVQVSMKLMNDKGKERVRAISQAIVTDKDGKRKVLIRFLSPSDVKGSGFLTHESKGREDDQWLFLPATKKVRRISAADQSDNFMGSDFAYEDLASEKMENNSYAVLRQESVGGAECDVVEAVPNEAGKKISGYSKRELWISKDHSVLLRGNFYDRGGKLMKVLEASDVKEVAGTGKWRPYRLVMKNQATGHSTTLAFDGYEIDKGLAGDIFSVRNLEAANLL